MRRPAVALLIVSAVALPDQAQPSREPPTSTAPATTISGRIVADASGEPLPNARVTFTPAVQGTPVVLADRDGRFALAAPRGSYRVAAGKSGYARSTMTPAAGQPIEIRLRRGATIAGRVVDEFGDAVPGAQVTAEVRSGASTTTTIASAETDDRGEYRLASLPAGAFVIAMVTRALVVIQGVKGDNRGGFLSGGQKAFYPGVATANDAEALQVQAGENRTGVDFTMTADRSALPPTLVIRLPAESPGAAPAQSPGIRADGVVRGRVVSPDGRAVPRAQVRLIPQGDLQRSRAVLAGADGRFEFREVAAGNIQLAASKAGYPAIISNASTGGTAAPSSNTSFDLADGETRERIDLALSRGGTLEGRVTDELGDPFEGASVEVLQVRYEAGRRHLRAAGGAPRVTDDLGRYRLYNLPSGQFIVSAAVGVAPAADVPGYARAYFPGTPNAGEAQLVSIGPTRAVVDINFSMSRTRTAHVSGKVQANGQLGLIRLMLMPGRQSASATSVPVNTQVLSDGTFEFPVVPPGQYVIRAEGFPRDTWHEGEFGTLPVSVNDADVKDLVLHTSSGSSLEGRVTLDTNDGSKTPALQDVALTPVPVDFDLSPSKPATASIHSDGSFEIRGVNGPRRLQLLRAPAGWALKEIRVNGTDVTDRPLPFGRADQSLSDVEVVLTDRVNELSGTITDDHGRPAPDAILIVVSTEREDWYPASRFLRKAVAGSDGAYTLSGLPAGRYHAAAVARLPDEGEDAWQDSAFLDSLVSQASPVTFGDGQKQVLTMRLPARERRFPEG